MPSTRTPLDDNLVRALRLRAASDPAFRESLGRVLTGDAKYEDYVQRKRNEGEPWLERDEWEAYVYGKDAPAGQPKPKSRPKKLPLRDPKRMRRTLQRMMRKKQQDRIKELWDTPSYEEGGRAKRLFSISETRDLPQWAEQPHGNRDRLLAQAQESQPLMLDWLDRGEGIDKALGARTVRRDEDPDAPIDLEKPGPVLVIAPPKTEAAADDKVRKRYGGDWAEGAVDLVRASIAVDKYEDLQDVVKKLKDSGMELANQPRNRFREATSAGYRDVVFNVRLPNGHIMELQLHLKPILEAKDKNHDLYSQIRGLGEELGDDEAMSEEQRRKLDEATMQMRQRYDSAWEEAVSRSDAQSIFDAPPSFPQDRPLKRRKKLPARPKRRAAVAAKFFDVDGLPVRWEAPKVPQIQLPDKMLPVKDLAWFAERAVPIGEDEFKILVKARQEKRSSKPKEDKKAHADSLAEVMRRRAETDPAFRRALRGALRGEERE